MKRGACFTLLFVALGPGAAIAQGPYDLLITGGTVIDGSGGPRFPADVAVREGRIILVSPTRIPAAEATRVIDASGLIVAPGFVDIHTHLEPLPRLRDMESHVRQGVTTAFGNPDGGGFYPIAASLAAADSALSANVGFFVGHNTIRRLVMGLDDRAPSSAELRQLERMVARGMGEGAFGLSTGLFYLPGTFAGLEEVVALAKVAADSGGVYTSHLRKEGLGLLEGVAEALEIGRRAGVPVVLTHHKVVGRPMHGQSVRTLAMIDSARVAGTDVIADQYPYTATYTSLDVLIPPWARENGDTAFARRMKDPVLRDSITRGTVFNLTNDRGGGDLRRVQLSQVRWRPDLEGKRLYDWAEERGLDSTMETGAALVLEAALRGGASAIFHALDEEDVARIMRHPMVAHASDARLSRLGEGHPHPRVYGTFPRILGHYVRDRGVLSLESAIRKMTSLPAWRMGLLNRGRVSAGFVADLVLFDPAMVSDRSTFEQPHQYPVGIPYVVVAGVPVIDRGEQTASRPGRVLRRPPGRRKASTGEPPA